MRKTTLETRNLTMNVELFENKIERRNEEIEKRLTQIGETEKRGLGSCDIVETYFDISG